MQPSGAAPTPLCLVSVDVGESLQGAVDAFHSPGACETIILIDLQHEVA